MLPDRQERIAKGVALVVAEGLSLREASRVVNIERTSIARALRQSAPALESAPERIASKALVATESAIERMADEIDSVDPKHLAAWAHTTARIAGLLDRSEQGSVASDVADLVNRLSQGGNTVTVGVKVEPK
jgi:transposase